MADLFSSDRSVQACLAGEGKRPSGQTARQQRHFKLVEQTKAKYSICDKDVYNFDEAGFLIDKITTQLVITALERRARPKAIQPGSREWYEEAEIPRDWAIAVSDNGWTTNELGVK
ncbi:hypothetical protein yc1106_01264 [Curvularia clavata]|uniref:Uncharacterized protein n=1 Tax=Curvularia clavata TaxID=95742 RepID=A0A9Q9DPB5_CURCL|nr:hypothetical protein yc1106_01264 [Curvularia clavata]